MRREVPFILMIFMAILRALTEVVQPVATYKMASGDLFRSMISYALSYMGLAAILMGIMNVSRVHWHIIQRRKSTWIYSVWLLVCMYAYSLLGLFTTNKGTTYQWIYNSVFIPLDATMFSILAFFIASAAYRAFKVRNLEAGIVLVVASLAMIAYIPLGDVIWPPTGFLGGFNGIRNWLLRVPNAAAVRAISLGIYLGAMATNWRVLLGIERRHLGQE